MRAFDVALLRQDWILRAYLWAVLLMAPGVLSAATYTVTNNLDLGSRSLRQAIFQANSNPGPDVIEFNLFENF